MTEIDRSRTLEFEILVEPRRRLASLAQSIGLSAWRAGLFGKRKDVELQHVYDPRANPKFDNSNKLHQKMEARAKIGRFISVVAMLDGKEVGYAWAAEEARRTKIGRVADKLMRRKLDVRVEEINVLPEHQGQGIGSHILERLSSELNPRQGLTAHIPVEMQAAVDWFTNRGFEKSPRDPDQTPNHMFGVIYQPADMLRLVASSVAGVLRQITLRHMEDSAFYRIVGEEDESIVQFAD